MVCTREGKEEAEERSKHHVMWHAGTIQPENARRNPKKAERKSTHIRNYTTAQRTHFYTDKNFLFVTPILIIPLRVFSLHHFQIRSTSLPHLFNSSSHHSSHSEPNGVKLRVKEVISYPLKPTEICKTSELFN